MNRPPGQPDPFEMDDAPYLLGALAPQDRARYEHHLQTCEACRRSLTELAGLPGVLRRLPVDVVEAMDGAAPDDPDDAEVPPPSVLAGVLERVRTEERDHRRVRVLRWGSAVTAAAAAVVVAVLAFVNPGAGEEPVAEPTPDARLELEALGGTPLSANVSLREVLWGTKIEVECDYPDPDGTNPYRDEPEYSLVVLEKDGDTEQVATWNAVAGRELTIDAATAVRLGSIASLEIRSQDGTVVLRSPQ